MLNTRRSETASDRLVVQGQISMKYGTYTLRSLGPKIWNKLPSDIKHSKNLSVFKELIKAWSGPKCHCGSCKYLGICALYLLYFVVSFYTFVYIF